LLVAANSRQKEKAFELCNGLVDFFIEEHTATYFPGLLFQQKFSKLCQSYG